MSVTIYKNGLWSLVARRYLGPFWIRRKWLQQTQGFNPSRLEELQLQLLQRLIKHCYDTVPYYRKVMDQRNIDKQKINQLSDITQFPILTKTDVLNAGASLVSSKYPSWMLRKAHTGGTTGTPMIVYRNLFAVGNEHAFVRRQWDWAGIGLQDRCAFLTGRVIFPPDQKDGKLYGYDPFMKELILSTYHLNDTTAVQYLRAIQEYQVKGLVGYPSAIHYLARICIDKGWNMPLKAVLTSSEVLSESMRQVISRAFQTQVYDFYGSAERVCYIFTCEKGSYHVIPEYGLTELIPCPELGQNRYKIVSTGFWNSAMPLIRYELGDTVTGETNPCSCGRSFPRIKSVDGRRGDMIQTPSGRIYGAAILTHLLYGTNHILESQIIQDAPDHLTIEYVPGSQFSLGDLQAFENLVHIHLPSELRVELKRVPSVQRTSSGKIRPIVSRI
jgi:phenylacetate-CoA ligase